MYNCHWVNQTKHKLKNTHTRTDIKKKTKKKKNIPRTNKGLSNHGVCFLGNALMVMGGYVAGNGNKKTNDCYVYDMGCERWEHVRKDNDIVRMPFQLTDFGVINTNDFVYTFGGMDHRGETTDAICRFNVNTKEWKILKKVKLFAFFSVYLFCLKRTQTQTQTYNTT